mgnify:CR=1 FL=1
MVISMNMYTGDDFNTTAAEDSIDVGQNAAGNGFAVHTGWIRAAALLLLLLLFTGSDQSQAQSHLPVTEKAAPGEHRQRVQRLRDLSSANLGWNPTLPALDSAKPQEPALGTTAYRQLHAEMLALNALTGTPDADTDNDSAGSVASLPAHLSEQYDNLQQQIRARVEANIRAGYFYAADVYIELFEQAKGDKTVSDEMRSMLSQQRLTHQSVSAISSLVS